MKKRILTILVVAFMYIFSTTTVFAAGYVDAFIFSEGCILGSGEIYTEQTHYTPTPPDYLTPQSNFSTSENSVLFRLHGDIRQHDEIIYVLYRTDHIVTSDEVIGWLEDITREKSDDAYEGDYLRWSFDPATSEFGIFYDPYDHAYNNVIALRLSFYSTMPQEYSFASNVRDTVRSFGFTNASTTSEKLQVIYEYLCDITVVPLSEGENNPGLNSAYSALMNKKATPLGVAALTRLMLGEINIYSRIIPGYVNGTPHYWNIASLGSEYYNIDIAADCGKGDYTHYFKGGDDFDSYQRLDDYDDSTFRAEHPMSSADFPFLPVEQGDFGYGMTWYFYPDRNTLVLRGSGRMPDFNGDAPWAHLQDSIESVQFVDDISYIGARSFEGYPNLKKLRLSLGIKIIGPYAFLDCTALHSVTNSTYLHTIGDGAFMNCTNLSNFSFAYDIKTIGNDAFRNTGITNVPLSQLIETIGERAFMDCTSIEYFRFEGYRNVPLTIKSDALSGTAVTHLTLPSSNTFLNDNAFRGSSITEIRFKGNAPTIASNAFSGVDATICYRTESSGWQTTKDKNYGGTLTWIGLSYGDNYCIGGIPVVISETSSTCQERGATNYEVNCYDCGKLLKTYSEYADLAPHIDSNDDEACDWCGTRMCKTHTLVTAPGTAPTCTEPGSTDSVYCSACEYVETSSKRIPPTGHDYIGYVCKNCGMILNPFVDITKTDYFYTPVLWALADSITDGTSPTTFSPEATCTRGQVVTFLWRAAGSPATIGADNPFVDVSEDAYYYNAVLWAVENGITDGTSPTTFGPTDPCTRGQVVTFLWRAFDQPNAATENPFVDVSEDAYYYNAVLWAVENGITDGTSPITFGPINTCTRGQIVTFLYRAYN